MAKRKQRKRGAFTLIELLVVIAIIALLVSILLPSLNRAKELAKRAACATRLHGLGQGVHLYANSYGGMLPTWDDPSASGAEASVWVGRDYDKDNSTKNTYSNSRGWFALVKGDYAALGLFRCPSDELVNTQDYAVTDIYDFMPVAGKSPLSYSLQVTKTWNDGAKGVTISLEEPSGLAIASDKNGLYGWDPTKLTDTGSRIVTVRDVDFTVPEMNSPNHNRDGQNVLYLGSSVSFAKTSLCGIGDDNIFTGADGSDKGADTVWITVDSTSDSLLLP